MRQVRYLMIGTPASNWYFHSALSSKARFVVPRYHFFDIVRTLLQYQLMPRTPPTMIWACTPALSRSSQPIMPRFLPGESYHAMPKLRQGLKRRQYRFAYRARSHTLYLPPATLQIDLPLYICHFRF